MNTDKWFKIVLEIAHDKIRKVMQKKLDDLIDCGASKSGRLYEVVAVGFVALKEEIRDILDKLGQLKNNNESEWEEIYKRCNIFIEEQSTYIYNDFTERFKGIYTEDLKKDVKDDCEKLKNDAIAMLELHIEIQKQLIDEKRMKNGFEILKIFFPAIIGGLIGAWARTLFE